MQTEGNETSLRKIQPGFGTLESEAITPSACQSSSAQIDYGPSMAEKKSMHDNTVESEPSVFATP